MCPNLEFEKGMLSHSLGGAVVFISFQHFIAPALDLLPCLQAWGTRDCNKGSKCLQRAMKALKRTIIRLTFLLYKKPGNLNNTHTKNGNVDQILSLTMQSLKPVLPTTYEQRVQP